ncbi:MAG: anthranilate phosphoribosyltransferase [Phaeodactylibacter sp.]|nr:anthranilate phosphoribosyltransferase [Phaeodactylibacter sp.]
MKDILNHLFDHQALDRETAKSVLVQIASGAFNPVQVASFITVYEMRAITLAELEGFRDALLELCVPISFEGQETIDIVGTGGDRKNTFNISTLSSVVVAGAGYKVTKHGSYGVSSAAGSSDVLIELGYQFTNDESVLRKQLDTANICFLHAPLFHPALKEVVPIRKQLGMKSFFNMLGPLVNPAQPSHQLFGTYNLELSRLYQYIMQATGRAFSIVYALDGYDEVSLTGPFRLRTPRQDQEVGPADLGLPLLTQVDLYGGETVQDAARIFKAVLQNESTPAQQDVVCANAGLAIHCLKPEAGLEDCIAEARESILSKRALHTFLKLVKN